MDENSSLVFNANALATVSKGVFLYGSRTWLQLNFVVMWVPAGAVC